MKRPPPDPAARVFTATERSQAAIVAREDALRHPAPSALERAVDDVKEGTAIGASIIAHAASSSAFRVRLRAAGVKRAVARRVSDVVVISAALGLRTMRGSANVVRAIAGTVGSGGRLTWHVASRIATGVLLALLAIGLGLAAILVGLVGAARTGFVLLARATASGSRRLWKSTRVASQAGAAAGVRAGVAGAKVLTRGGTVSSHAANHARAASRAFLLHLVGAARTGFVLLARATATGSQRLWKSTRVASQAGAAAGVRAGVAGAKVLARGGTASSHAASHASASARAFLSHTAHDIARLRLTIRWHARSARPILGAVAGEFIRHLLRSVRQARPRHLIAGIAVAAAVLIAAVYGATGKDRRAPNRPPVPVSTTSASSQPALASLAPAPDADAAALVESLKEKSAALLAPSTTPQGTPAAPKAAVPGADTDQERAASPGESMVGTLLIASAPKGAKVTIDGIPRGVSPLSVSRLRAGNRIVRLELDGYQRWSWAVYVSASRQTRLNVSLVPDSGPSPSSAVTNTAAAAK